MPPSSAQFWLQRFSPSMVSMVRSYNGFACNRHFGSICSSRWSKWEISSSMIWWWPGLPVTGAFGKFDEIRSSERSKRKHFITNGLVTSMFCHVFMEIQAGRIFCIGVWTLWFLAGKEFWWHASSPLSFENFTMEVVKIQMSVGDVLSPFCMLEGQVMRVWTFQRWDIGFACMETSFKPMSFFWNKSKTNNLYKRVFDVFLSRAVFS